VVKWVEIGVVDGITVVCELTLWSTIVIVCIEVMWIEDWLRNDFFIDIVNWNVSLFKLRNIWFVKSSFPFN